jgi:hypothetical protein
MLWLSSPPENWQNDQLPEKAGLATLPLGSSSGSRERAQRRKLCAQIPTSRGLHSVEDFSSTILDLRDVAGSMRCSSTRARGGRGGAEPNAGLVHDPEFQAIPKKISQDSI